MASKGKRKEGLFAVNAFSDVNLDESDQHAYSILIGEYFADSDTEAETDTECGKEIYVYITQAGINMQIDAGCFNANSSGNNDSSDNDDEDEYNGSGNITRY